MQVRGWLQHRQRKSSKKERQDRALATARDRPSPATAGEAMLHGTRTAGRIAASVPD